MTVAAMTEITRVGLVLRSAMVLCSGGQALLRYRSSIAIYSDPRSTRLEELVTTLSWSVEEEKRLGTEIGVAISPPIVLVHCREGLGVDTKERASEYC